MYPKLNSTLERARKIPVPTHRKAVLEEVAAYVREKLASGQTPRLNFICTHNSRRSQFSQIWAQTAAAYFGIEVDCFSGGVELTAFNERAVASLIRSGFTIEQEGVNNPKYRVSFAANASSIEAYSKLIDETPSPFAAVMTCADADENCPFIPAAEKRIPLRYEDPKAFDDTPQEAEKYDERSLQIASEMCSIFQNIAQ